MKVQRYVLYCSLTIRAPSHHTSPRNLLTTCLRKKSRVGIKRAPPWSQKSPFMDTLDKSTDLSVHRIHYTWKWSKMHFNEIYCNPYLWWDTISYLASFMWRSFNVSFFKKLIKTPYLSLSPIRQTSQLITPFIYIIKVCHDSWRHCIRDTCTRRHSISSYVVSH